MKFPSPSGHHPFLLNSPKDPKFKFYWLSKEQTQKTRLINEEDYVKSKKKEKGNENLLEKIVAKLWNSEQKLNLMHVQEKHANNKNNSQLIMPAMLCPDSGPYGLLTN